MCSFVLYVDNNAGFSLKLKLFKSMTNNLKISIRRIRNPFWQLSFVTLPRHAIKVSTDRIQNSREEKKINKSTFFSVAILVIDHGATPDSGTDA